MIVVAGIPGVKKGTEKGGNKKTTGELTNLRKGK